MRLNPYPVILAYHCVAPTPAPGTPTVTPEAFERQVQFLARRYRLLTLREAAREWLDKGQWPARTIVITFDDGDDTTDAHAWPILQRYRAPATVFMIAGNVDHPRSLTRAQLAELAAGGIEIGSHTVHHAYLPSLTMAQALLELQQSKTLLSDMSRSAVDTFSYPAGGFSAGIRQCVQQAGYLTACTTNRALNGSAALDRWALRRIKMTERSVPPLLIRAKLSGYYDHFRKLQPCC